MAGTATHIPPSVSATATATIAYLEEIGDYVGHSSSYRTDAYRHLLPDQRERAAERLGAFLAATGGRLGRRP